MRGGVRGIRAYPALLQPINKSFNHRGHRGSKGKALWRMVLDWAIRYSFCDYLSSWSPKWNRSIRLPIAGLFNGTYGLLWLVTGLGKLSRLRAVRGASPQLASMNFRIEAWSVEV